MSINRIKIEDLKHKLVLFLLFNISLLFFYQPLMFRHLSPKVNNKDKPTVTSTNTNKIKVSSPVQQPINTSKGLNKEHEEKGSTASGKDIKTLNTFFAKPTVNTQQKKPNIPLSKVVPPTNNSSDNIRPVVPKAGSVFDDYYQKKPKPIHQVKPNKEEVSLSGDSYQSQGYVPLKKVHNTNTRSIADKIPVKTKNLVAAPLIINQQQRGGFKSPNIKSPINRSGSQDDPSLKRVLSFGGKKPLPKVGDNVNKVEIKKKVMETSVEVKPSSPSTKNMKFPNLNISGDQKNKRQSKPVIISSQQGLPNKIPTVLSTGHIKSPLHHKYTLDSSNEFSGDLGHKKQEIPKNQPLLSQLKKEKEHESKDKKDKKSLSFNKGQMFMNLKKRQEHHTQLCKEINTLGIKIEVKLLSNDQPMEFILVKKLCEAKNTAIFVAYHQKNSSLYCLKRVTKSEMSKNEIESLIKEHKIQQFCRHPHLVKTFGTVYDSNHIFLVMQYMEEGTLGHQLRHEVLKHMSEQSTIKTKINESITTHISKINKIRRILFEIGGAINYLHERSIIHRDIKPDNIFISHETYKLGDFGSASHNGSLQYVGTLDYAAPQILTQLPYDNRVDIWSLGCVAYELEVGRPPFFHISQEETKRLAIQGQYDKTLIGDPDLKDLIEKMLVPKYQHRITACELSKHDFFNSLKQEGTLF